MYRNRTCGQLNINEVGKDVTLSGWVQKTRDLGGMTFVDLRDRYGITQLVFNMDENAELWKKARNLGREYVIQVTGKVMERSNKNHEIPTGEIEVKVDELKILNRAKTPPFTIENDTDGGDELRMQYRYLDLRRPEVRENILLRHKLNAETRAYMNELGFLDIETPFLIKSTPEGARDFVVPSRMNEGQFYALPQSPQTFKQLLMVSGFDKYYQIVRCFRDEDLRADRQPEFTQIDCEMSFVEQDDIFRTFEGLIRHLFKAVKGIDLPAFEKMDYADALRLYGSDKPDLRFGMELNELNDLVKNKGFNVFEQAELVLGITIPGGSSFSRKEIDGLTDWVKRPQIGMKGLAYSKWNDDGNFKSSVDKFYTQEDQAEWAVRCEAKQADMVLILAGDAEPTQKAMGELRLEMGRRLGLMKDNEYKCLWIVDFPLLEWDEETNRYHAMHHPFTSPKPEDLDKINDAPGEVRANAYDMVINGVEVGGGSIRIHDRELQSRMLDLLGFSKEEAQKQFGFLMSAFEYGAPPHGGIAFGFDRLCAIFGGSDSIRDFIAFPKNNSGRDVMLDAPASIDEGQLDELGLKLIT